MAAANHISSKPLLLLQTLALAVFLLQVHSQDTTSTSFNFNSFEPKPDDLTYQGDVFARDENTLSLTKIDTNGDPERQSVGRVLFSNSVLLWDDLGQQATFQTTLVFTISSINNNPGDGITFFIAPVGTRIPPESAGGNLGIFGQSGTSHNVFAVEFDTFSNSWDPNYAHIGIDVSSRDSVNTIQVEEFDGMKVTATISYNNNIVNVNVDVAGETYSITSNVDLQFIVPRWVQVGISGATGQSIQYNYLHSWNFTSIINVGGRNEYNHLQSVV